MTDAEGGVFGGTNTAATCRAQGWEAGTLLAGDAGYGETVIEVTAVGQEKILARCVVKRGLWGPWPEMLWQLSERLWREVSQEYVDSLPGGGRLDDV